MAGDDAYARWACEARAEVARRRYLSATMRLDFVRARAADQCWRVEAAGLRALLVAQGWTAPDAEAEVRGMAAEMDAYWHGFLRQVRARKRATALALRP